MSVMLLAAENTGGIIVAPGGMDGGLVSEAGHLQFGEMLLGGGTSAGWRELIGWRDTPEADVSDAPRPQAHGAYPGDVWGSSLVVTFTYLVRGTPEGKAAALDTIERYAPMDGVERVLAVHDGSGAWFRRARVIGRQVPQDRHFRHGPVECSLQFLCADPRRYALQARSSTVALPASSGGLVYPLVYPLEYGTSSAGAATATNAGTEATPLVAVFHGPLTNPALVTPGWRLGFDIVLANGESLTVDTSAGTALLNDSADRLYTLQPDSDPLERCQLQPGDSDLSLTAEAGTGRLVATYHDARI